MKPLTSTQLAVISAEVMTNTNKEALEYLLKHDHKMELRTYQGHKKDIHKDDTQRLFDLAKAGKENQMKRIDEFKVIKAETWKIYTKSDDDSIRLRALKQVTIIEPFIAAAEAAVPYIIKEVIENFGKQGSTEKQRHAKSASNSSS